MENVSRVWLGNGWKIVHNIRKTRSDCKKGRYTGKLFTGSRMKKVFIEDDKAIRPVIQDNRKN